MLGFVVLAATLALDRALGWAGFPADPPVYPVGPPHLESRVETDEYSYTRRTNDRGIRYRTVPLEKPAGTYRVVLVGDSFTEGACVEVEQRWSDVIERQLAEGGGSTVELINCGEAGTHPVDHARTLIQLGLSYEPDAVVIGLYFDDIPNTPADLDVRAILRDPRPGSRLERVARTFWPHTYTILTTSPPLRADRWRPRPSDIVESARRLARERGIDEAEFERWLAAVPEHAIEAINAGRLTPGLATHALSQPDFFYEGIGIETEEARAKARAVGQLLSALHGLCRERGIRFGTILMPSVHQFHPRSSETLMARVYAELDHPVREEWKNETTPIQREFATWAEREGVPFLDLVPVFRTAIVESEEDLNYTIDPHWTPAGHVVAARAIQGWMEDSGLLP